MAGPNTTGKPRTSDYNLGRGQVYFAELTNGIPGAYRDLGNAPEFSISVEVETLEHQSSRQGLRVVDKEVIISQKVNLSLTLDEINHENLALLFSGSKATYTNAAIAGFAEHQMIAGVELGRWYDIKSAANARAYDIEAADLTVEQDDTVDVLLVLGTDYELDLVQGRIFFLSTAVNIAAGENVNVTLAAEATAGTVNEVRALTQTNVVGALKFISINPANNDEQTEFQFHQISLKSEGDFSLIGDEFTVMQFTAVAEANAVASPNSPTLTIRNVA